jgi:NADH:ubiquinone oxidoreductase subunit H
LVGEVAFRMMVAVAVLVVSATLAAVIVTVSEMLIVAGAV